MLNIDLTIFPILETDRLTLRRLDINDLNTMYTMRTDPEMMKYIPTCYTIRRRNKTIYPFYR